MVSIVITKLELEKARFENGFITPIQTIFGYEIDLSSVRIISTVNNISDFERDYDNSIGFTFVTSEGLEFRFVLDYNLYGTIVKESDIDLISRNRKEDWWYEIYMPENKIFFTRKENIENAISKLNQIRQEITNRWNVLQYLKLGINFNPKASSIEQRLEAI